MTTSMTGTQPGTPARIGPHTNASLVVLFLALAGLSFSVLQSLVAPAMPTIARDLNASTSDISWILTAYLLSASVLTPIFGRLGDMVGKRRMMLVVLVVLAIGTTIAGLSTSLPVLIAARAIQGAAGAVLPLSIGIVRDELPRERVGMTVGMLSAVFGIGAGLGIVLAGPIVEHLSWEWLFWLPLALILVALAGVWFGVPESPVRTPGRLDLLGTAILSASLISLLLAVSKGRAWGWGSGTTLGLGAFGLVVLTVFVLVELRVKEPLINMRLMANRGVWATNVVGVMLGFAMFGTFVLLPLLLELPAATGYGFGKTVAEAGLFILPATFTLLMFGPISGLLDRRFGPKVPLFLGSVVATVAFVVPALSHSSIWSIIASGLLTGVGLGLAFAAMANAIIKAVPASHTGEAISVNSIVRTIGGSIGTAVVAAVLGADVTPQGMPTDQAFTTAFWVCAGVGMLAIAAAIALPSANRRQKEAVETGVSDLPPEPEELHVHLPHPHLPHGTHADRSPTDAS